MNSAIEIVVRVPLISPLTLETCLIIMCRGLRAIPSYTSARVASNHWNWIFTIEAGKTLFIVFLPSSCAVFSLPYIRCQMIFFVRTKAVSEAAMSERVETNSHPFGKLHSVDFLRKGKTFPFLFTHSSIVVVVVRLASDYSTGQQAHETKCATV